MYTFQSEPLCVVYLSDTLASELYSANGRCMKVYMEHCGNAYWQWKTEILGKKPVRVPICPPLLYLCHIVAFWNNASDRNFENMWKTYSE